MAYDDGMRLMLISTSLLLAIASAGPPLHAAQPAAQSTTGAPVPPPSGSRLVLTLSADGVQIYTCKAQNDSTVAWTFSGPEATLSDKPGHKAGTHSAGPTWTLTDGSTVVGEVVSKADAPEAGAIPWLLLRVKSHAGTGALATAAYIRRIDTKGGNAPASGCDATHASQTVRVPYTATYQFFAASTVS